MRPQTATDTHSTGQAALLEVSHLVGGYDGTAVIKDCNMDVQPGEIVVIMGGVRFREIDLPASPDRA